MPGPVVATTPTGQRTLAIPGLFRADGVTPLPFAFDRAAWLTDFYPTVLAHRAQVYRDTRDDDALGRAHRQAQLELCRQPHGIGNLYWCLTFGWIDEPRNPPGEREMPFVLTPRQVELLLEMHDVLETPLGPRSSLLVEKSRDVGVTWCATNRNVWGWLFWEGFSAFMLSLDAKAVENNISPGAWFFKIDFMLRRIPSWMLPKKFSWEREPGKYRTEMTLAHPNGMNVLLGDANTPDAGRGERYFLADIDEAGYDPNFDEHWNNLYNVTDHRHAYSTATRKIPHFYNAVHGKAGWPEPRLFRVAWDAMPERDARWLANAKASMQDDKYRRELLIDYDSEIGSWTYPQFRDREVESLAWDKHKTPVVSMDDGWDDDYEIVIGQVDHATQGIDVMASYGNNKKPIRFYGTLLTNRLNHALFDYDEHDLWFARYAEEHRLAERAYVYGDRHGKNTSLTDGENPWEILLNEFGLLVQTSDDSIYPELKTVKGRRDALREMSRHWRFHDSDGAPRVLDALQRNHLPERKETSQAVSEIKIAVHDPTIHLTTCCEYIVPHHLNRPEPASEILERNLMAGYRVPMPRGRRHIQGETVLWTAS